MWEEEDLSQRPITCPVCRKVFSLLEIEAHADVCAELSKVSSKPKKHQTKKTVSIPEARTGSEETKVAPDLVSMSIDPNADFETSVTRLKVALTKKGAKSSLPTTEVFRMLDQLMVKYQAVTIDVEDDWVYVEVKEEEGEL